MNLEKAAIQWRNRPVDERFWGLDDMLTAAETLKDESHTVEIPQGEFCAVADTAGEIGVELPQQGFVPCTNYAFDCLAARASAPAEFLRRLPTELAVNCLNDGLAKLQSDSVVLYRTNGTTSMRAVTSKRYGRIWYADTLRNLQGIATTGGWRVPPGRPATLDSRARPATEEDILRPGSHGLSIKVGDEIAPAGAYLSDRDMFIFMVDETKEILPGLFRGFFLANSEVRARVYEMTTFLYQSVCGNHIVWSAEGVKTFKVKHITDEKGNSSMVNFRAMTGAQKFLDNYGDSSSAATVELLRLAGTKELGATNKATLETVQEYVNKRKLLIPAKFLDEAQEIALTEKYGNPRTAFAFVSGLTQIARDFTYSDKRAAFNTEAGKIIDIVR